MRIPWPERSLDLSGTEVAMSRLRAVGATGEALPAYPGLDMQGFLDRIMRDLGFPNGAADVVPKVLPWLSWLWS